MFKPQLLNIKLLEYPGGMNALLSVDRHVCCQSKCMNYSHKLCNQILYACVLKVFFSTASLVLRKVT